MPNVVKGSRQERMVVVPYRPWRSPVLVLAIVLAVSLTGVIGFYAGHLDATRGQVTTTAENQRLRSENIHFSEEVTSLRSNIAILDRNRAVDQRAAEEAQGTINSLRSRVNQLEQDVMFYRQVMVPDSSETGLVIAQVDVYGSDAPDRFQYKLVFRQQGQQDRMLEGQVSVSIAGKQDGENHVYSLRELMVGTDLEMQMSLAFRYFQNVEGELQLPAGFVPEQIQVNASSVRPTEKTINTTFSWLVSGVL